MMFKTIYKASLLSLGLTATAHAVNPVTGWYLGVVGGASFASSVSHVVNFPYLTSTNPIRVAYQPTRTSLSYKTGGNGGLMAGYRINNFRVELEPWYNYTAYDRFTIGNTSIALDSYLKGNTYVYGGLLNAMYEFYTPGNDGAFAPYIGVGLGYGSATNELRYTFTVSGQTYSERVKESDSVGLAQGIAGIGYYVDDFTMVSLDYRYTATSSIKALDSSYSVQSANLSFVFALDTVDQ